MILTNRHAFQETVRTRSAVQVLGSTSILDLNFPDGNGMFEIETRDLARLISSTQLEVLKMRHVSIQGDLGVLLPVLRAQKQLRSFRAEFCSFSYRIVAVVSTLPSLETLNIVGDKAIRWRRPIPVETIIKLLEKGNLKDLRLDRIGNWNQQELSNNFFQAITNSPLQVFWCLSSNLDSTAVHLLAKLIQETNLIKDIRITVAPLTSSLQKIADSLKTNRSLTNLGIRVTGEADPSPKIISSFLKVLKHHNTTLLDLIVARATQWDLDKRRHVPVFQNNQEAAALHRKIDFYLSLNREGRATLLQDSATPEDLLRAVSSQWDLSIVYYFLRCNPTLPLLNSIEPPSPQTQAQETAELNKRFTAMFPDALRQQRINVMGPRQVQDLLVCLPILQSTTIAALSVRFPSESGTMNWKDLTCLLQCFKASLHSISLEKVSMVGSMEQQFDDFNSQLSHCQHLSSLSLKQCNLFGVHDDSFAKVLSGLPQFDSLEWIGNKGTSLSSLAIANLIQSRPIKFLALDCIQQDDDDGLEELFQSMEQSTSLRVVHCQLHDQGFSSKHLEKFGRVLASNKSLENLRIRVNSKADMTPLAVALKTNLTLTGLHITGAFPPLPDLSSFAAVLEKDNSTLKSLIIGDCDLSSVPTSSEEQLEHLRVLLQSNIARSRPPPLLKPCYKPS